MLLFIGALITLLFIIFLFERAIGRAVRRGRRLDREAALREEDRSIAVNDRELERAIRRGKSR